ncbi:MAG: hypothetical protein U0V74_03215 [Chitinophagales bacterium]
MQLTEITLLTNSLPEIKNFYRQKLNFNCIDSTTHSAAFQCGASILRFQQSNLAAYYHFAFNIDPVCFNTAHKWAEENLQLISYEKQNIVDFPNWNARSFYFLDPAGNILEFIARFDLPSNSAAFSTSSILGISEIGIVTDPVSAMRHRLQNNFNVQPFFRQTPTDEFCPMGDDNGLLIVVTQHRNWFPTTITCMPFPLKIKFTDNNGQSHQLSVD